MKSGHVGIPCLHAYNSQVLHVVKYLILYCLCAHDFDYAYHHFCYYYYYYF